ncbi:MAG: beta-ketoacyl-[acyl-carrier-protein] synthase family protein [Kiritimatiellia bacterium]
MSTHPQRIFVTGMGAITPLGFSVAETWRGLLAGTSAIGPLDLFDLGGMACTQAGQIRNFTPPAAILAAGARDRASSFAAAACLEALAQASVPQVPGVPPVPHVPSAVPAVPSSFPPIALVTATNFGALDHGESALVGDAPSAAAARDLSAGVTADRVAKALGLTGPRATLTLSCAAGAAGLAYAAGLIRHGRAERVLVVGYDAISRFAWSGLCALRTMTKDCVRPFDLNRSGTIFTEGAAALLLESEASCHSRQGTPLVELVGWGTNNNGFHITAPAPRGAGSAQAMRQALARGGLLPEAIDHINAHGTGTKPNDATESQAIADVFGARAPHIPVTSIKSSLGHMLGAAGTIEAIAAVLSLREGVIPPTTHFETPDPECSVDLVANQPRTLKMRHVLSNSAGIGGCNAAVIFRDL